MRYSPLCSWQGGSSCLHIITADLQEAARSMTEKICKSEPECRREIAFSIIKIENIRTRLCNKWGHFLYWTTSYFNLNIFLLEAISQRILKNQIIYASTCRWYLVFCSLPFYFLRYFLVVGQREWFSLYPLYLGTDGQLLPSNISKAFHTKCPFCVLFISLDYTLGAAVSLTWSTDTKVHPFPYAPVVLCWLIPAKMTI